LRINLLQDRIAGKTVVDSQWPGYEKEERFLKEL
jgi:hypothetical protein